MRDTEKLEREIEFQMQSDILAYSWLLDIARRMFPDRNFESRAELLIEALTNLVNRLDVSIGPTKSIDSVLHVQSWAGLAEKRIQKLRDYIAEHGDPDLNAGFGFWVALPKE